MKQQVKCTYKTLEMSDKSFELPIQIQEATNPDRVIRFKMSDDTIDRDNEVIVQEGWDFSGFVQNPVCMAFHDLQQWPLGKGIAVGVVDGSAYIDMEFDPADVDERAEVVFKKVLHGTIKAGSVNFIPAEIANKGEQQYKALFNKYAGARRIFLKQSLLEWTVCPIGANPNALAVAVGKRFGAEPFTASYGSDGLDYEALIAKMNRNIDNLKG